MKRVKPLKGELLNPLWWKLAVTFVGAIFALIIQFVPPAEIATFPEDASPRDFATAKIGGFALITAVALFAGIIRTGTAPLDKLVDGMTGLLGVLAAFGAGWNTLSVATSGNPGLYLYGAATLTGIAVVGLLIGGGMWAAIWAVAHLITAGVDAAILFLKTTVGFFVNKIRRRQD